MAQYANNALVSDLTLQYSGVASGEYQIDRADGQDLTIKIGYGLLITNYDSARGDTTAPLTIKCGLNYVDDCALATATISNKGGNGIITITLPTGNDPTTGIKVVGVRVDASALAVGDEIKVNVTSTTDATTQPLGGADASGGVSGPVAVVAAGLKVTAKQASSLACSTTNLPSITVAEGFGVDSLGRIGAWGPSGGDGIGTQTASIKIVLDNVPDGASVKWPASIDSSVTVTVGTGPDATEASRINGTLTKDDAESSSNGRVVVYDYARETQYGETGSRTDLEDAALNAARSFEITPEEVKFGSDASVDIAAMLFPAATRSAEGVKLDLESDLSFEAELQNPKDDDGNNTGEGWLVVSECVTYLLYPFVTCGATSGWSTGISVSNTSADANIFGAFDESSDQKGSVVMYGFPKGQAAPAEGEMVEPVVSTLSTNLMAGDTLIVRCADTTMAGMEGYAIIRAGFQHARGMAFVFGDFGGGAGVDVSHGYMAEVITNPADRTEAID